MPPKIYIFTAKWCGPCQRIKPRVYDKCKELKIDRYIEEVDLDDYDQKKHEYTKDELVDMYKVSAIPLVICKYSDIDSTVVNLVSDTLFELNQFAERILKENQFFLPHCIEASVECQTRR